MITNKKEINIELLVKVVSIQSSHTDDQEINEFIEKYLKSISGVKVSKDDYGNIYATKGSGKNGYKCIVSHTDTVHGIYKNRKVYIHDNILFAMASTTPNSISPLTQVGIGGDDKSGVYACLQAVSEFDDIKAVFFRFEESGCKGSRASDMSFFSDCNFVVQLDRRGNSDFITHTNGIKVASKEFEDTMKPIYEKYGFSHKFGVSTDVGALKSRGLEVSACNISAGYFEPHSKYEVIDIQGLHNSYLMVSEMFEQHGNSRFEHKYEIPKVDRYSRGYSIGYDAGRYSGYGTQTSMFGSSYFGDTIKSIDNKAIEIVPYHLPVRMNSIYKPGDTFIRYRFIDNDMIDVEQECPTCGAKNSVVFLTEDKSFMCIDSGHNEWVNDDCLYMDLYIEDRGKKYVYDRVYDLWLDKNAAIWDDDLKSYKAK